MKKHIYLWPVLLCSLLAGCRSPQEKADDRLLKAVISGDDDEIRAALADGATPNVVSKFEISEIGLGEGQSAIQWAVYRRRTRAVIILAEGGADVRANFHGSGSALKYLVGENELDIVRRLVERDASILAPTHPPGLDGKTLLKDAIRSGRLEMAKLLLQHGAPQGVVLSHEMLNTAAEDANAAGLRFILENNAEFRKPATLRDLLAFTEKQKPRYIYGEYKDYLAAVAEVRQALKKR